MIKTIVIGAGGFIGGHLVSKLKEMGRYVIGIDIKYHEYKDSDADVFIISDMREYSNVYRYIDGDVYEIYQLAADMGGAGYIFTKDNDADILYNSSTINLNVLKVCSEKGIKRIFFSSSACIYPEINQLDPKNPMCSEDSGRKGPPDSCYGWEKIFSEILYEAYSRNYGIDVKIARFHNIFGPYGTWRGGKEKSPFALCRKVCDVEDDGEIEIWGTGEQTRSFLYIDECIEGIIRLMDSDFSGPVNIGSEEMISINDFAKMIIDISGKKNIRIKNIVGPVGVNGRNSDNGLIIEKLGWSPSKKLREGIKKLYEWIVIVNGKSV